MAPAVDTPREPRPLHPRSAPRLNSLGVFRRGSLCGGFPRLVVMVEIPRSSGRHRKRVAARDMGDDQPSAERGPALGAGFAGGVGDWHLQEIQAGVWFSKRTFEVPRAVLALTPEPQRLTVVVDAEAPD